MLPTSREASAAGRLRPNALVLTGLANFRVVGYSETIPAPCNFSAGVVGRHAVWFAHCSGASIGLRRSTSSETEVRSSVFPVPI
jgi:hypothetical protein